MVYGGILVVLDWALRKILMRSAARELERAEPGRAASTPPGQAAGAATAHLLEKARAAERVLAAVEVPGFDVDLLSSGAVKRIRVSRDGGSVAVFIDFTGSDPSCYFCKFINWSLWRRILRDAADKLKVEAGFREVVFFDWATGAKIEYEKE